MKHFSLRFTIKINFKKKKKLILSPLLGNWRLVSSENFERLMRKLKINFLWRKIGKLTSPNQKFELNEHNHNEWTFTCRLYIKNVTLKFRLNEEFDETLPDGQEIKVL